MFDFLVGKKKGAKEPPQVDLHSHLLPGIDDGVKTTEESLELIKAFQNAGFKKLITTPHIMQDYYPNNPEIIQSKLIELKKVLKDQNINIELETAAEYYLDDIFLRSIKSGDKLLTFGKNYLLFETTFQDKPLFLEEAIFEMQSKGYFPILAHPERYNYLIKDWKLTQHLKNSGVLFQLNTISLGGFYSSESKKFGEKLIDNKMIDFVGSDCHGMRHFDAMMTTMKKSRYWNKVMALSIKNNSL